MVNKKKQEPFETIIKMKLDAINNSEANYCNNNREFSGEEAKKTAFVLRDGLLVVFKKRISFSSNDLREILESLLLRIISVAKKAIRLFKKTQVKSKLKTLEAIEVAEIFLDLIKQKDNNINE